MQVLNFGSLNIDLVYRARTHSGRRFVARRMAGEGVERALQIACRAAAITVARPEAMDAIPRIDEVLA